MITCERCGADAVDARGRCRNCGWQAPPNTFTERGGSPSLGETRAADIPSAGGGFTGRTAAAPAPPGQMGTGAYHPSRSFGAGLPPVPAAAGPTSRYCGTCGARLEPGRAFCGQCGAPVSVSAESYSGPVALNAGSSRYQADLDDDWSVEDGDAPTEEIPDIPPPYVNPYGPSMARVPNSNSYGGIGYAAGVGAPPLETPSGGSRTVRILFGMLCLFGSAASAVAAIILALANNR